MRHTGLHSRRRPLAPNLLKQDFSANVPNKKWVGDILGIWTDESWLYLAALLDTYSRFIVGWAMSVCLSGRSPRDGCPMHGAAKAGHS